MALINRVRTVWTGVAGAPYYTNLYFLNGVMTEEEIHTEVSAFITSLCQYICTPLVATIEGDIPLIDSVTGEIQAVENVGPTAANGLATGSALPRATQVLLRFKTGQYVEGRQLQGRMFVPWTGSGTNDDGQLAGAAVVAFDNILGPFLTATDGALIIWSRKTGAVAPVTAGSTWNEFAQLRSRRD